MILYDLFYLSARPLELLANHDSVAEVVDPRVPTAALMAACRRWQAPMLSQATLRRRLSRKPEAL